MGPDGPKLLRAFNAEDDPIMAQLAKFSLYADRFLEKQKSMPQKKKMLGRAIPTSSVRLAPLKQQTSSPKDLQRHTFNDWDDRGLYVSSNYNQTDGPQEMYATNFTRPRASHKLITKSKLTLMEQGKKQVDSLRVSGVQKQKTMQFFTNTLPSPGKSV